MLVWRLDRLSRNLQDLWRLVDRFAVAQVGIQSVTEQIDLTSATGRMMFNIYGTFAQFYREQLSENVRMGLDQAVRQGRHVNRAKYGYRMEEGMLVPDPEEAETVRQIFGLRVAGASFRDIETATGVKFSTARTVVASRTYLGEVPHRGEWFPGSA